MTGPDMTQPTTVPQPPLDTGAAGAPPMAAPPGPMAPPSAPRKSRTALIVAVSILGACMACSIAGVAWFLMDTVNEMDVYDNAESLYLTPANAFIGDGTGLQQDAGNYIVNNASKLTAARKGIAAARKEIGDVGDPIDRKEYLATLAKVDTALGVLEAMALSPEGPEGLSVAIEKAGAPLRNADDSLDEAFDAYQAKDYSKMLIAATAAEAGASKAESALAALEADRPGLGIGDLGDYAGVTARFAAGAVALAKASAAGDKADMDTAEASLNALNSKYDGAQKRAFQSVANTLWKNPGRAVSDALQQLDKTQTAHEATYNKINGEE